MNPTQLLTHFDRLSDAPNAIPCLRRFILDLAVRGKLVEQNPSDEPASELLKHIKAEKSLLTQKGKIKAVQQNLLALTKEGNTNTPWAIPSTWDWVSLGETVNSHMGGGTPSKNEYSYWGGDIFWASVKDVGKEKYIDSTIDRITNAGLINSSSNLIPAGNLIVVTRMGLGKISINRVPIAINQDLRALLLSSLMSIDYQYIFFKTQSFEGTGLTVKGIKTEELLSTAFPLPPLAEQHRIVAKVDELMALCDQLEAAQTERERRRNILTTASLNRLNQPTANAPAFRENARFHLQHLPRLTTRPEQIQQIRQTILSLAVRGKLVEQDPKDELSSALIAAMLIEKQHFAQKYRFREQIEEPKNFSALPFAIPNGWTWCRLNSLCNAITDGDHLPPPKSDDGIAFLTIGNITTGELDFKGCRFVPSSYYEGLAEFRRPVKGDILYTVVGATYGRPALVNTNRPFCVQRHIAIFKPSRQINVRFLMIVLRSQLVYDQATAGTTGIAQPTVPLGALRNFIVAFPPLAEQHRIVAKVNELMTLCNQLEAQLITTQAQSRLLLDTLMANLVGNEQNTTYNQEPKNTIMTTESDSPKPHYVSAEPLNLSTRRFSLRRFTMSSKYRSLGEFDCTYHSETADTDEASHVCLVGLNGSGKSNLIEALAEVFCFLELINLPWKKVATSSSRYRENRHTFELEYMLQDDDGERFIRIRKTKKSSAEFFVVSNDGSEKSVEPGREQLLLLPRRIIGYSSGLNETVSHPFLRTKTFYSEEVRNAAPLEGTDSSDDSVFDTRTLYMDYDSNAAIIISNYIFRDPEDLTIFNQFTRVKGVSSFGIRFNRKRGTNTSKNNTVRLTTELKSYLRSFALCAGVTYREDQLAYNLKFQLTPETAALFRQEFETAENLFMAMHKWSLLNALILSNQQRKVYLGNDITKGALERPPSVPPSDRVFNIVDLRLTLSSPAIEIDYSGLSDGEHQFIQVFGTALLFSEPGTLFLLDEPESHFNPEWRTNFNRILNGIPNAGRQEYVISTHSPFVVSGSREGNVYKFTRTNTGITCELVDFETYGASFDDLLKKLFSIESMIDQSARQELENIIKGDNILEMQEAIGEFAESREKRRLYEAILRKEQGK